MKGRIPVLIVFAALVASAGERSYRSGILKQIEVKDVTGAIPISTPTAQNISIPLFLGINYQFQVQADIRVLPKKDDNGEVYQMVEPLPPFASRQMVPECRETYENQKAKPLQRSRWKVGWVSRNKTSTPVRGRTVFLTSLL